MIDNDMHRERWSALQYFLDKAQSLESIFGETPTGETARAEVEAYVPPGDEV
jgi:hypothetical protein